MCTRLDIGAAGLTIESQPLLPSTHYDGRPARTYLIEPIVNQMFSDTRLKIIVVMPAGLTDSITVDGWESRSSSSYVISSSIRLESERT